MHFVLHSVESLPINAWVIDIGVSNHMCVNFNLLTNPKLHASPIHSADVSSSSIKHIGNVILNKNIILYDALHIVTFKFNLFIS